MNQLRPRSSVESPGRENLTLGGLIPGNVPPEPPVHGPWYFNEMLGLFMAIILQEEERLVTTSLENAIDITALSQ